MNSKKGKFGQMHWITSERETKSEEEKERRQERRKAYIK